MPALTEAELADGLESLYDQWSNDENIDPEAARRSLAEGQANLIAQFVQGRTTQVTGVQNGSGTAQGIIQ